MKKLILLTILFLFGLSNLNCMEDEELDPKIIADYKEALGECDGIGDLLLFVEDSNHIGVRYLIAAGVDVNAVSDWGDFALWVAVRNGDIEMVRILIEEGRADPLRENSDRNTPIGFASYLFGGSSEIVKILETGFSRELRALIRARFSGSYRAFCPVYWPHVRVVK